MLLVRVEVALFHGQFEQSIDRFSVGVLRVDGGGEFRVIVGEVLRRDHLDVELRQNIFVHLEMLGLLLGALCFNVNNIVA